MSVKYLHRQEVQGSQNPHKKLGMVALLDSQCQGREGRGSLELTDHPASLDKISEPQVPV